MAQETLNTTKDPKFWKRKRYEKHLLCSICGPNKGENAKRHAKHGNKKPKYKKKRVN